MPQINLSTGSGSEKIEPSRFRSNLSIILSLLIIAATVGVYFGVVAYRRSVDREFSNIDAEITSKRSMISGEKANRVADFSDRLSIIGKNLSDSAMSPNEPLSKIERSMVPGVNLSSYEYDLEKRVVRAFVVADSFRSLAEQLVSLKQQFSSVQVEKEARLNEDGKVESGLLLAL